MCYKSVVDGCIHVSLYFADIYVRGYHGMIFRLQHKACNKAKAV